VTGDKKEADTCDGGNQLLPRDQGTNTGRRDVRGQEGKTKIDKKNELERYTKKRALSREKENRKTVSARKQVGGLRRNRLEKVSQEVSMEDRHN